MFVAPTGIIVDYMTSYGIIIGLYNYSHAESRVIVLDFYRYLYSIDDHPVSVLFYLVLFGFFPSGFREPGLPFSYQS